MRTIVSVASVVAAFLVMQSCSAPFGCEPSEPFEAIVIDNVMLSYHNNGYWADKTDTVLLTAVSSRRMDFKLDAIPKRIAAKSFFPGFSLISTAYACSPLYLPYSLQKFNGSRITSNLAFGNDYPAGSDLSALFELNHWSTDGKTIDLKQVLDSLGLDPLLSEARPLTSYTFKGQALQGQIARFQWELYLDADTLRNQSAWWQF